MLKVVYEKERGLQITKFESRLNDMEIINVEPPISYRIPSRSNRRRRPPLMKGERFIYQGQVEKDNVYWKVANIKELEPPKLKISIDLDKWKDALEYSEAEIDQTYSKLIKAMGLPAKKHTISWLKEELRETLKSYEKEYDVKLTEAMEDKISAVLVKMIYDRLYYEG